VAGLIKPTAGQILIDGEDIVPLSEDDLEGVRAKMGVVFQYAALFDSMNVFENMPLESLEGHDEEKINASHASR
jgi:phospholipid/cholesterol/gamma-HCH transport system ATP-binding protein